jgi:hypothetical protein
MLPSAKMLPGYCPPDSTEELGAPALEQAAEEESSWALAELPQARPPLLAPALVSQPEVQRSAPALQAALPDAAALLAEQQRLPCAA